ncbi:MAG: diacylglycerol/lipid kinase family protein [Rudaea sp.]
MRALLIHNPSAGTRTLQADIQSAIATFTRAGWEVALEETQAGGDATRLARQCAEDGFPAAFAVGGDGTINEVLNGLVGTETALGVLPYGTGNVWAKQMGFPIGTLASSAKLQLESEVRCIDVGEAEGDGFGPRYFVLWCGVGFDADIAAEIERDRPLKRRLGALAFWVVGTRRAFTFRGRRARITIDGQRRQARVLMALASNAQLYGGIVRVSPAARLDDGLLDLAVFEGTGLWRTAWHLLRVFLGWHLNVPDVEHYQGREITIQARGLPVHLDAEPVGKTPVRITVKPGAVRVLVPPTANKALFGNGPT